MKIYNYITNKVSRVWLDKIMDKVADDLELDIDLDIMLNTMKT